MGVLRTAVISASILAGAACRSTEPIAPQPTTGRGPLATSVAYVTMKYTTVSVKVGESFQLQATPRASGGNATAATGMTWRSVDPKIVTVDENGLITGIAPGWTSVIADADGHSASTVVTVTAASP